jgi:AbrB family looped-hinge helix DNA binding protein
MSGRLGSSGCRRGKCGLAEVSQSGTSRSFGRGRQKLRLQPGITFCKKRDHAMESALSIKGQATIPKAIRDHLHLEPGDRIKFFVHPDGSVVILPKASRS